jgi:RNA-binding protein
MSLSATERRALKARAHALEPVVRIGSHGLTPAVEKEIDLSLRAHELIKVHVAGEDRDARRALLDQICQTTGAEAVQTIGRMLVLWRELPRDVATAPAKPRRRGARIPKRAFQGS